MGRHNQKPAPTATRRPSPRRPVPRLNLPEVLQDYCTWPILSLALAVTLVLGVLIGVLIS